MKALRIILCVLGVLLALLLLFTAVLLTVPLTETGDKTTVEGSADWMSHLPETLPVSELVIPGTHDSATQYVQLAFFSKCQAADIAGQLAMGYRYLDIRLGADGDQLMLMHGFTRCTTGVFGKTLYLDRVLSDCYAFLEEHPGETVLFAVKQEHGEENVAAFQALLDSYIAQNPEYWLLGDTMPYLGQARGKLVLLRRYEDAAGYGLRAGIPLLWDDQSGSEDVSLHSERSDNGSYRLWVQDRYEYGVEDKWNAFTAGVTVPELEEGDVLLNFLSTKGTAAYGHPYSFAKKLNARLLSGQLPEEELRGWIAVDFASAPLAESIYRCNLAVK